MESLNLFVTKLNEELASANKVIKNFTNHSSQLEILVIEKQEITFGQEIKKQALLNSGIDDTKGEKRLKKLTTYPNSNSQLNYWNSEIEKKKLCSEVVNNMYIQHSKTFFLTK